MRTSDGATAVPLLKLLKREHATKAERLFAALFEGAGKPVGGDADAVVRPKWVDEKKERDEAAKLKKLPTRGA